MNEGPTTVGSIVGKLQLDRAQWVAEMAATKRDVRELEGADPTINVHATVGEAIAKMDAAAQAADRVARKTDTVTAAQARLTAAQRAADTAYARTDIAQKRLNETREKAVAGSARLASAELALSEAERRLDEANAKVERSELDVTAAQQAAAAAALEESAAQDRDTASKTRANEANKTAASRVGMIAAAVGLLLPLLTPLAAGAIGISGALTGMGAAGVLALIGIHREMQNGTAVGAAYRTGLDSLNGSLSILSHTAAVGMLGSFQRAVQLTNDSLPGLNAQVGQFSTLLGRTGLAALQGVLNVLRVLNPLFLTAGVYVESLAQGFQHWTEGAGLQQFGSYALAMLPPVTDLLGSLAATVLHILQALAPLGTIGMAVLGGISDLISAIPVDVLSQLIVTVTWGAIAFKAWGFIAPMLATVAEAMGAVGVATTIATGPIGWIVAALSAMAGIFAVVIAQNQRGTQAMQEYTSAVQQDTGAIGQNVRAKAAQKLADDGVYDSAKKLGISLQTVTDATLGHKDALRALSVYTRAADGDTQALQTVMDMSGKSRLEAVGLINNLVVGIRGESDAISGSIDRYKTLQTAIGGTTTATAQQTQADQAAASALGISASVIQQAAAAQKDNANATQTATAQMYLQNDAAGLLKQTLDLLNGKTLDAASAQNQFDSQLANMGAHIDKTGKDVNRATASLDGNTAAAVANRGELINSVQAAEQAAQAYRDNGASAEDTRQKLIDMKQAIIDHAVAVGEDRGSVQAFIDKLFQIPASIPPTKVEVDTARAEAALAALTQTRTVFIQARYNATADAIQLGKLPGGANGTTGMAGGGTAYGLANGGGGTVMGPGNASSDTAGLYRLAHGEEVVSNKFGQADRWRAQLKAINAGYTPTRATSAPAVAATNAPAPAGDVNVHVNVTGTQQTDPNVLGAKIGARTARALAGVPGVNR